MIDVNLFLNSSDKLSSVRIKNMSNEIRSELDKFGATFHHRYSYGLLLNMIRLGIITEPECHCGNKLRFTSNKKFINHCSVKCAASSPVRNASIQSKIDYKAAVEKSKQTRISKYGSTAMTAHAKTKAKATVLAKYGVENVSQSIEIKNKKQKTFHENFPLFDQVRKNLENDLISGETPGSIAQKYNIALTTVYNFIKELGLSDDWIKPSGSSYERVIESWFDDFGITYEMHNRQIIAPKELDFWVPSKSLAIEVNGAYWHAQLDKFAHLNKTINCQKAQVHLLHFWDVLIDQKPLVVKSIIQTKLGINVKIPARKCQVVELTSIEYADFCNKNHIQGHGLSSIRYGLVYNGTLVAVMGFSRSRFDKKIDYELVRFSCLLGHTVVGGASKLLSTFQRNFKGSSLISYADRSLFDGNLYLTLGFKLSHITRPGYYYYNNRTRMIESRQKYQKHKLSKILTYYDPLLTESQNMINNGYYQIWDCGQTVWIIKD